MLDQNLALKDAIQKRQGAGVEIPTLEDSRPVVTGQPRDPVDLASGTLQAQPPQKLYPPKVGGSLASLLDLRGSKDTIKNCWSLGFIESVPPKKKHQKTSRGSQQSERKK